MLINFSFPSDLTGYGGNHRPIKKLPGIWRMHRRCAEGVWRVAQKICGRYIDVQVGHG